MSKDNALKTRLSQVATLQALKSRASHAELAQARSVRAEAEAELLKADHHLEEELRQMEATLSSDALNFTAWQIGRAVLEALARNVDIASADVERLREQEDCAREVFSREDTRRERAEELRDKFVRKLREKRDNVAALEANGVALVRKASTVLP